MCVSAPSQSVKHSYPQVCSTRLGNKSCSFWTLHRTKLSKISRRFLAYRYAATPSYSWGQNPEFKLNIPVILISSGSLCEAQQIFAKAQNDRQAKVLSCCCVKRQNQSSFIQSGYARIQILVTLESQDSSSRSHVSRIWIKKNPNQCRLSSFWLCQIRNFQGCGFGTDLSGRLFGLNTVTSEEHCVICGASVRNSPDNCKSRLFNLTLSKLQSAQLTNMHFSCCEKYKRANMNQEMENKWIKKCFFKNNSKYFLKP